MNETTAEELACVPQSGRGPIGYCHLGYAAPIGWTREQVEDMPRLRRKLARLAEQKKLNDQPH